MEYESIVKISQATVTLALVLLVILYVPSVLAISYGYLFSVLITLTVFLLFFSYYINPIKIKFSKDIFAILQISWPLSFGFVPGWVYISINSIMLGYFGFIEENGWYGASMRIAVAAMIISHLLIKSFYPALSSFYVTSKEKLHKAWNYLAECMVFLVIPVVVGGVLLSEKIINTFYGQGFAPAIFALQLLMVVVGISFINYPYTIILIITDRQKHNFIVMCLGGALNIGLNMALIPWYGLYGAIFSTMLASLFVLGATVILSQKAALLIPLYKRFFITLAISLCCAGGMSAVIALMLQYSINVFIICFLGGCFYIVSFVLVSIWLKQVNLKALWKTL
jgi:O-antigen/teichoic acid export membrane protein